MNPSQPFIGAPNTAIRQQTPEVAWIWEGVVALGAMTLLSAPEKIGKTTLLSLLLDRRRAGGQLLGRTVWPGKTLVCTEEDQRLWALRQPPLDFGPDVAFRSPQPYEPRPEWGPAPDPSARWRDFIENLLTHCLEEEASGGNRYDLLVIDTAMRFLPLGQRNRGPLREALAQLADLLGIPLGVLIINQSRTVHRPLAAHADIVIEMEVPRGFSRSAGPVRRRVFTGVGRYPGTLDRVDAELNAEGTDYLVAAHTPPPHSPMLTVAQKLLADSEAALTHHELLERWPAPPPHPDSLWRTLATAVEDGVLTTTGKGTKTEPQRFALARRG